MMHTTRERMVVVGEYETERQRHEKSFSNKIGRQAGRQKTTYVEHERGVLRADGYAAVEACEAGELGVAVGLPEERARHLPSIIETHRILFALARVRRDASPALLVID